MTRKQRGFQVTRSLSVSALWSPFKVCCGIMFRFYFLDLWDFWFKNTIIGYLQSYICKLNVLYTQFSDLASLGTMSILQAKRKRQDLASTISASMTNEERAVYNIIRGKKEMGIWQGDIKRETNIPDSMLKKSIKLLISKTLIKEVVNIQNKSKKVLMAMEFEPSKEITGGEWYTEGRLDTQLIDALSDVCLKLISRKKVATRDAILEWTRTLGSEVFPGGVSSGQVEQILKVLVMENKVQEVNSTGFGDFSTVPAGEVCFRLAKKVGTNVKAGAMASIPCGVCPRIKFCTPNGVISPTTCQYYQKWLDF